MNRVQDAGFRQAAPDLADGINFIDEDNARRRFLCSLEQSPHPQGPNTHQHLIELTPSPAEKVSC